MEVKLKRDLDDLSQYAPHRRRPSSRLGTYAHPPSASRSLQRHRRLGQPQTLTPRPKSTATSPSETALASYPSGHTPRRTQSALFIPRRTLSVQQRTLSTQERTFSSKAHRDGCQRLILCISIYISDPFQISDP
ncbi:hypothetical protein BDV98DRAFT_402781 [Pterulicium gracile]|uniref:Uncharacterized protein n=1 Tax=Pterulicium gracile TaxID=1884261 RepID=A0A5C3QA40_9AGAR|nr:hypothetical protein BDV98DRAFT_402781 [Pterula gracilis]